VDGPILDVASGTVGDVVDEHGQPGGGSQRLEMLEDAALVGTVEVGTRNEGARERVFLQLAQLGRHPTRVVAAHARDYRQAAVHGFQRLLQDFEVLVFCDGGPFASCGQGNQSGNALASVVLDECDEALVVDFIVKERSDFNALPGNPVQINSTVLPHTIGVPTTYLTKTQIQNMFHASTKGMWDDNGNMFQPSGLGAVQVELSQSDSKGTTLGGGFSIEQEYQVIAATALFGVQFGFSYDYAYTVSTTNETIVGATMPYLPASAPSSLSYQSGIAAYTADLTGQSGKIWVVNFWVN